MSALGRLVAKTLRKEMGDVFADYGLKSEDVVSESPLGQTKRKPAAAYIKQMQKEGVSTEEMQDLGLLDDFDPKTGSRRQEQLTRDEMLEEINKRRAERLESRGVYRGDIPPPIGEGETVNPRFVGGKKIIEKSPPPQFESPEPVTGPQSKQRTTMTSYNIYQQDIGDPDTYEEITYGLREGPEGKRAARRTGELSDRSVIGFYSRSEDEMGLHFPERDQLFHLRLNRGKTTDGEGVTNLLELQSDIQQRAQKGTPLELKEEEATPLRPTKPEYRDPTLPMVHNWEVLGVKEAVRRAVQNGDRYLAITPGREIGRAVGAVEAISTEEPLKAILTRSQSGKIDIIFTGLDIRKEYSDLENIDDLNIVNPKMSPDVEEILSGMGYEEYLNNPMEFSGYLDDIENARFENNLSILARAMVTVQFNDFGYKTLSAEGIQYAEKLVDDFMDSLVDYGVDVGGDVEDFVAEITEDPIQVYSLVLPESIIDRMLTIRSSLEDSEAIADEVLQRMYTDEQVAKALNINIGEVRRLADSGESVEITPEMGFGGEGVIDFYDKTLISEKRLQKYGAPLVEIEQTRPDGTTVTTNALDLKKFIDAKKKNKKAKIPYSLYSAVLGIPLAGKLGSIVSSQEQTQDDETTKAFDNGGLSQSEKASKAFAQMNDMLESGVKEKVTKKDGTLISKTYKDATYAAEDVLRMLRSGEITREQAKKFLDQQKEAGNYADGGLLDEGGTVDPVSGNDVPSGSTQAEVRDDIDAKLSEGEFVFPADVTRYIGLENLMMLRQKAKEGLAKMEAMGQMGNGDEAVIPDNVDFKAEIGEMIKNQGASSEPVEMDIGGVTPTSGTPTYLNQQLPSYLQPSNVYTTPKFTGEQQQSTQSVYQPGQFVRLPEPGQFAKGPITQPTPDTRDVATQPLPYEMKKFVNEQTKAVAYIPFMNGQPMLPIPEGYVEEKRGVTPEEEDTTAAPETAVETTKVTDTGGDSDSGPSTAKVKGTSVVGVARGISDLFGKNYKGVGKGQHPLAEQVKDYRNAQIRGIGGALLSVVGGGGLSAILGAGASIARMNKKMNEVEGIMQSSIEKANPTLGKILNALPDVDNISTGQIQKSFTNAIDYGLSPGLAAAMSVTPQGFRQPTLDIDPRTGQQQISLQDQGLAERAVQNAFSPETIGEEAYRDMIEEAAFFDATGMGSMTLASDTGYAGRTAMQRQAETRAKSIDTQVNELASRENITLDQARSIVEGRLSREETPAGGIKVEVSKDPLGDAIRSSALSQGRTEKEATSKFNQAVRNIARGEESRGRSVDPSNFSVTNVTSRGEINVDINGDGKADRAIDKDGNSRNYNIDRDDSGGRGSSNEGGSMSGGGFGGDDGYGGPSFKKGGLASQTNRAFGLMARKK